MLTNLIYMTQNNLLYEIRNEYTGEKLSLDKDAKRVIQRNNETINRALEELSVNLYKKEFHFIMELIQNAEDNDYKIDTEPFLRFILDSDKLIVQNNEIGFNEENVRALCDIKKSTKKKVDGYVGEKGIGFKSVFKVARSPEIYSNGYSFRFHADSKKSKKKELLGFILPEIIDDIPEYVEDGLTNIVLPFKKKDYSKFSSQLNDIQSNLLLFLRKLKTIQFIDKIKGTEVLFSKQTISGGLVKLTEEKTDRWSNKRTEYQYFRLFSEHIRVPIKYAVAEREKVEKTEILIGFPIERVNNKYQVDSQRNCHVFNFLPINDYNFRFIIQADFILTSNRESIDESKRWNFWIRDEVNESIKKSFLKLQRTGLWKEYLNYLPRENEISEDFFVPIIDSLMEWVKNSKIIPIQERKTTEWVRSGNIVFYDKKSEDIYDLEFIKRKTKCSFLHPNVNFDSDINRILNIEHWTWELDKKCISDKNWIASLRKEQRENLYIHLWKEYRDYDSVIEDLKDIKIFFIDGKSVPVSINESEDAIFWTLKSKRKYRFLNSVRFLVDDYRIHESTKYKRISDLFKRIGVREPKIKSLITEYIFPKYDYGNEENKSSKELTSYHVDFIYFLFENYSLVSRDKPFLKLVKEKIWLRASDKKFNKPDHLYLSHSYDESVIWDKIFTKDEVVFLSNDYLTNGYSDKKEFAVFLYEIGIKKTTNTHDVTNVFNSENLLRIKRLLIYLNDNWNDYFRILDIDEFSESVKIPIKSCLYSPAEVFIPSRQNRFIFGDTVNYLPRFITNKNFIRDIGINHKTIPERFLVERLRQLQKGDISKIDKRHLITIYSKFRLTKEINEMFSEQPLLYSFRDKKWLLNWQAVWTVNIDLFADFFAEFGSQYPTDLVNFFVNQAGVNLNIQYGNIIRFLESISSKSKINIHDKLRIERALGFLANSYKNRKINADSIEDIFSDTIYPDEDFQLKSCDYIYFADNDHLFKIFQGQGLSIFNLSIENIGFRNDIIEVAETFNLRLLSEHHTTDYIPKKNLRRNNEWSENIKDLLSLVGYILNYRSHDLFKEFCSIFENVDSIKVYVVDNLEINYQLEDVIIKKQESFYIIKNKIFINEELLSEVDNLIIDIAIGILGNHPTIQDIILLVHNIEQDRLFDYFNRFNIPYPEKDYRTFAKDKKKKLKEEEIISPEYFSDDDDNKDNDHDSDGLGKFTSSSPTSDIVNVSAKEWIPEADPDFEVDIEIGNFKNGDLQGATVSANANAGFGGGYYPRYKFNSDKTYEKEIGEWGEKFAFTNLSKELIKNNDGKEFKIDEKIQRLQIFDDKRKEVAFLENRNAQGLTQSGYDFLLRLKGIHYYIEVKSTSQSGSTYFNLEEKQWECFRKNKDKYILIIVRNAGKKDATIEKFQDFYKQYEEGFISIRASRMTLYI